MGHKLTFDTHDIWQAAFVLAYGGTLVTTTIDPLGRATWILDNTNDKAWQSAMDFRCGGERALADVQAIRNAYRYLSKQAADARTLGADNDYRNRD